MSDVSRATLATQLEQAIRHDIVGGFFRPGQRLRYADLTERYQVSATPVREAIQRLAAQNLVEIDQRIGATVTHISRSDFLDTYWLRDILGRLAISRSVELGDDAWRSKVSSTFDILEGVGEPGLDEEGTQGNLDWSQAHRDFHETLFAACGSPWLVRLLRSLQDHAERYITLNRQTAPRDKIHRHALIFEAVASGDQEAAADALTDHLYQTVELLESNIPALEP